MSDVLEYCPACAWNLPECGCSVGREIRRLRAKVRALRAKLRDRDARLKVLAEQHATSWCNCEPEVNWQCRGHEIANTKRKNWRGK